MKVTSFNPADALKVSHRKENKLDFVYSIIDCDAKKEIASCRFYFAGSTSYCCFWIFYNEIFANGSDKAGGYGYHKASAAAQGAINSAGFQLSKSISGVGDGAIEEALQAIAEHLGVKNYMIHKAHA